MCAVEGMRSGVGVMLALKVGNILSRWIRECGGYNHFCSCERYVPTCRVSWSSLLCKSLGLLQKPRQYIWLPCIVGNQGRVKAFLRCWITASSSYTAQNTCRSWTKEDSEQYTIHIVNLLLSFPSLSSSSTDTYFLKTFQTWMIKVITPSYAIV